MTKWLTGLLYRSADAATFEVPGRGTCSATDYRELHEHHRVSGTSSSFHAVVHLKEDARSELTEAVRMLLGDRIEGDRIGNGFTVVDMSGPLTVEVSDFVLGVVRATAVLGPERVTQLLDDWAKDKPFGYRWYAVLSGITSEQPLVMGTGISFETLPSSYPEITPHLHGISTVNVTDMLGALKVTVECMGSPAFYRLSRGRPDAESTWQYGQLPKHWLETLCEALALACNHRVTWKLRWADSEASKAFRALGGFWGQFRDTDRFASRDGVLSQNHLEDVHHILTRRLDGKDKQPRLDRAVSRWIRSKRTSGTDIADQLIELRIALEALYLPDAGAELGFRLATRGAWHLGADFSERRKFQTILREAYKLGSNAVHAGGVESSEDNRKLLTDAQDLCRKGILMRLDESGEPSWNDWNDLILGKELEDNP